MFEPAGVNVEYMCGVVPHESVSRDVQKGRKNRADGGAPQAATRPLRDCRHHQRIYTKWDAEYLVRSGALVADRIAGVETGGCPHTAIREDASANLAASADMRQKFPALDLVLTFRNIS
jgi:hypothetical protein